MIDKRILAVVDAIARDQSQISEVIQSENEYYFRFKGHAMSIMRRTQDASVGAYSLFIYPNWSGDLNLLAEQLSEGAPDDYGVKMASYHSRDYGDERLGALHQLLENKFMNVDDILDDILS